MTHSGHATARGGAGLVTSEMSGLPFIVTGRITGGR